MQTPSINNYRKPRPIIYLVIGDTLLYASTAVTGISIANEAHIVAYISLALGILGYFFSKLFAATDNHNHKK